MPPVQAISVDKNRLSVRDARAAYTFDASTIPVDTTLVSAVEAYCATTWVPSRVPTTPIYQIDLTQADQIAKDGSGKAIVLGTHPDYQLLVHVFSVAPFVATAWCANADEPPPPDGWWKDAE